MGYSEYRMSVLIRLYNIESQPDQETEFIIVLLKAKPEVKPVENIFNIPQSTPCIPNTFIEDIYEENKQTIMLVEDNIQLLSFLRKMLMKNYNVFCASNGKEALDKLMIIPKPDIIISDIIMDEMDGYSLYNEISGLKKFRDIPFIFLTAVTSISEKVKGLSKGALDFITKPFSIDEIQAKISSLLQFRRVQKETDINEFEKKIASVLRKNPEKLPDVILEKYDLTFREREVLKFLYQGLQYKEISDRICISLAAVRKRVHSIYKKFSVQNRTELIVTLQKKQYE